MERGRQNAGVALACVLVCVVALGMVGRTPVARAASAAPATTVDPLAVVKTAADAIVASDPLQHLNAHDPFGVLANQAVALTRAARVVAASDPSRAATYESLATAIASDLVQQDTLEADGAVGWGLPGAWDAFGDGTVNPPHQIYGFQTALVSEALLDVYADTGASADLAAVEAAMAHYAPSGTAAFAGGCSGCFMFWYSTNTNDAGRYVKNTNVLMGLVAARLYQVTGDPHDQALAAAVYQEETYEIVQHSNLRYLGVDDPHFNLAAGPEAHIVLETFAYSQLAAALGLSDSQSQAVFDSLTADFWACGAPCLAAPVAIPNFATTVYAQFMACYPAAFDSAHAALCQRMIALPAQTNLLPFPLIGLLYALPALSASLPASPIQRPPRRPPSPAPPRASPRASPRAPAPGAWAKIPPEAVIPYSAFQPWPL